MLKYGVQSVTSIANSYIRVYLLRRLPITPKYHNIFLINTEEKFICIYFITNYFTTLKKTEQRKNHFKLIIFLFDMLNLKFSVAMKIKYFSSPTQPIPFLKYIFG